MIRRKVLDYQNGLRSAFILAFFLLPLSREDETWGTYVGDAVIPEDTVLSIVVIAEADPHRVAPSHK